jgi:uncharacterized phiE125 gp8 family phage protein
VGLSLLNPPDEEPVNLAQAKLHLRVEDTAEDALIGTLIGAARRAVEAHLRRALVEQTWVLTLDAWPPCDPRSAHPSHAIRLPLPDLIAVEEVLYTDPAGVARSLDPAAYQVSTGCPGRIAPAPGRSWPATRRQMDAVAITYTCGYGSAADVPETVVQAMLLTIGNLYQNRESVVIGTIVAELPLAAAYLLASEDWGSYS